MATQFADKAKDAFLDDDFDRAVEFYSKTIDLNPSVADFCADRAQAQIKLNNFSEAVADANKAIELVPSMVKAYLRKGTACVKLEEYHTVKTALQAGDSHAPGDIRFAKLIKECEQRIAEESVLVAKSLASTAPSTSVSESVSSQQSNPVSLKKPRYRHEFYQQPEEVVVTIFAKGIPANNVVVDFGEQILSVRIDVSGEDTYHFQPRLCAKIVPEKSRYQVLSTKIEIRLAKAEYINWPSLEYSKEISVPQKVNYSSAGSQRPALSGLHILLPSQEEKIGMDWKPK